MEFSFEYWLSVFVAGILINLLSLLIWKISSKYVGKFKEKKIAKDERIKKHIEFLSSNPDAKLDFSARVIVNFIMGVSFGIMGFLLLITGMISELWLLADVHISVITGVIMRVFCVIMSILMFISAGRRIQRGIEMGGILSKSSLPFSLDELP